MTDPAAPGPLRVCAVTTSYPRFPGDFAGHFVHSLNASLAALGHEVAVVAPHAPGAPVAAERDGVEVRRFRYAPDSWERVAYGDGIPTNVRRDPRAMLGLPAFAVAMRRAVREASSDADIVHVNWAPTAALAGLGGVCAPVVLTLHGSDTTLARRGGVWLRMLRAALGRADAVIAVSAEQVELLEREGLWTRPERLRVLPSGVPDELLGRVRPVRAEGAPFRFLFVGRLIPEKGVADLLDAFAALPAGFAATLTFAGKGPMRELLAERADELNVAGRVSFEGEVPHGRALELMAGADALVLPSHGEGSPLSVVEAMALGTPVIGARVGAVPDLLGPEGLTHAAGDIDGLLRAMSRLVADPVLRDDLAAGGRERVREGYTWPRLAERTATLYREVLHGR